MRRYPATRSARTEALHRLHEKGRRITRGERDLLFDVLMSQRLFAEADTLLRGFPSDSLRIVRLEGLFNARQYEAIFADHLVRSPRWPKVLLGRWHLVHARAARNAGRIPEMERRYAAAALLGGSTRETALAEWAREAESNSRNQQADSLYTLLTRIPGTADEAHFRRGIARFALQRLAGAEADFALLRKGPFAAGGEFWLAKIAQARRDSASAHGALAKAAGNPSGYYARRARVEADRLAAGTTPAPFWDVERDALFRSRTRSAAEGGTFICPAGGRAQAGAARIRLLRRFARTEWAEREVGFLTSAMPADRRADRFFCLGLPDLAIRVAVSGLSGAPISFRYPRPYPAWISERAAAASLAPELVWAIARRESLFDPGALSSAGARGLLQLMDETAIETSRKFGMQPGPLERGDRNLELGTRHLRDLREEHDWSVPAIVAAYNAGSSKTEEWVTRFPDPDLFIERIGWRETRDYVKNVLEACWIYRDRLDGRSE
jgi:soluble lytic murein transglycosylase-like protein